MTVLEDRISNVLANQAEAMAVPEVRPHEQMARVVELQGPPRRSRVLVATAAAALLVAGVAAISQRRTDSPVADAPADATLLRFETPTVLLEAASVEVTVAGESFVPTVDVVVAGDPGTPNEYTTLELTWHQHGVEQRINIYFASDGTNWWADEIRTYDGEANADWIEQRGEFFKSPLGGAYSGDLDLPNLKIRGMRVQAFRRPSACGNAASPLALVADFPVINAPAGSYGATLQVFDTATCESLGVSGFTFSYVSDDQSVAAPAAEQLDIANYPTTKTRVDLDLVSPGATTIHVIAKDEAGSVVGTADMHVTVLPADATVVGAATTPFDTSMPVPAPPLPVSTSPKDINAIPPPER
jgi:hypothetical protein